MKKIGLMALMAAGLAITACGSNKKEGDAMANDTIVGTDTVVTTTDTVPAVTDTVAPANDTVNPATPK